jgi:integrase
VGRKRRRCNEHLPRHVYRKRTGYIYRRDGKDTYLCKQSDPASVLWAAVERLERGEQEETLRWMLGLYTESNKFKLLADRTRKAYHEYAVTIAGFKTASGAKFGDARLDQISPISIRGYLDKYPAPIAANRHIQFLKAAWNWAAQRHVIPDNPCIGVDLNAQPPRDRYVTPEEFAAFKSKAPDQVQLFMELAYLCRARWSEVASLRASDETPDGLRLTRSKGSEGEITAWSPRLRAVVNACKAHNADAPTPITGTYLIHDKRGRRIKQNAFQTAWGRLQRKWEESGGERFTFHDLKSAGYSDQREQWAGHKSDRMHKVYSRKLRIVEPPA